MTPTEFPLTWPPGIERAEKRGDAKFRSTLATARQNVFESLRLFGDDSGKKVSGVILSSNVSGLSGRMPDDPGVAVWFVWDGEYRCIAVDRYKKVEWNLQAIHHIIDAERVKLRHGGLNIVRSTFRAYMALAAPGARSWRDVLGIQGAATQADIEAAYKSLSKKHHPDVGGDTARMAEINAARDAALKEVRA